MSNRKVVNGILGLTQLVRDGKLPKLSDIDLMSDNGDPERIGSWASARVIVIGGKSFNLYLKKHAETTIGLLKGAKLVPEDAAPLTVKQGVEALWPTIEKFVTLADSKSFTDPRAKDTVWMSMEELSSTPITDLKTVFGEAMPEGSTAVCGEKLDDYLAALQKFVLGKRPARTFNDFKALVKAYAETKGALRTPFMKGVTPIIRRAYENQEFICLVADEDMDTFKSIVPQKDLFAGNQYMVANKIVAEKMFFGSKRSAANRWQKRMAEVVAGWTVETNWFSMQELVEVCFENVNGFMVLGKLNNMEAIREASDALGNFLNKYEEVVGEVANWPQLKAREEVFRAALKDSDERAPAIGGLTMLTKRFDNEEKFIFVTSSCMDELRALLAGIGEEPRFANPAYAIARDLHLFGVLRQKDEDNRVAYAKHQAAEATRQSNFDKLGGSLQRELAKLGLNGGLAKKASTPAPAEEVADADEDDEPAPFERPTIVSMPKADDKGTGK